jgi:hypothetical protein
MTLDELLLEWSYRSEKGYPSLDNPSDIQILKNLCEKLNLPINDILDEIGEDEEGEKTYANKDGKPGITSLEPSPYDSVDDKDEDEDEEETPEEPETTKPTTGGSESYDSVIRKHLGLSNDQPIPISKNSYPFPGSGGATFNIQVKSSDMKYWKDFWELTPPKEGETEGGTKGVGNGEISLYWLYQYSNSNVDVKDTRGADNPDLKFDGLGVEVKAYTKHTGKQGLGRFGQDTEQLKMLGVIFGINALAKQFEGKSEGGARAPKNVNPLTWDGGNLRAAMEEVIQFQNVDLSQLAEIYPIFKQIQENLDFLNSRLGDYTSAEEAARAMALEFVKPKIERKPGQGGFLVNVLINGDCRFWQIDYSKIVNNKDALKHIKASQGSMAMDFNELFS